MPTAVAGFASVFGDKLGSLILAVGLLLFATSTILGWALYGTRCAEFLFGSQDHPPLSGSLLPRRHRRLGRQPQAGVGHLRHPHGLLAIPNLIGILLLSPVVIKLTKEHFNGVKAGKLE